MFGGFKRGREASCTVDTLGVAAQQERQLSYEHFTLRAKMLKMLCRAVVSGPHETYVDSRGDDRIIITNNAPCDTVWFHTMSVVRKEDTTSVSLNGTKVIVNSDEIDTESKATFSKSRLDGMSAVLESCFYALYNRIDDNLRDRFNKSLIIPEENGDEELLKMIREILAEYYSRDIGEVACASA